MKFLRNTKSVKSVYSLGLGVVAIAIIMPTITASHPLRTQDAIDRMYELIDQGYSGEVVWDQLYEEILHCDGPDGTGGIDGLLLDGTPANGSTSSGTTNTKPAHTHNWIMEETKPASCLEEGEFKYTCKGCGETYTEPSALTDHDYVAVKETPATCTTPASVTFECTMCKDTLVEEKPGELADHIYIATNDSVKPTCTEAGHMIYKCSVCEDTYEETPEALGHEWEEEYTVDKKAGCETDGEKSIHCNRCDIIKEDSTVSIEPMGHTEKTPHDIREATFWEKGEEVVRCNTCNEIMETISIPATGKLSYILIPAAITVVVLGGIITGVVIAKKRKK